jgi:hypothetical protein
VRRSAVLHIPNPRPYRDSLIAATALVHGMTLVTRNITDFEGTETILLNLCSSETRTYDEVRGDQRGDVRHHEQAAGDVGWGVSGLFRPPARSSLQALAQ